MASSSSPCAACKFLRRKCTQECVFAPYFPPDQPQKFSNVHKVFGASNVAKILNELTPTQREDAVNSLAYEAEARLRDPVYGCVGLISILQHRLKQVQHDLITAKKELATYIGPSAMLPLLPQLGFTPQQMQYNNMPAHNPQLVIRESQNMIEAQQHMAAAAARDQQEMMRTYEHQQNVISQQQRQQDMVRFSGGFDQPGAVDGGIGGFTQMPSTSTVSPALALGSSGDVSYQVHQGQQEHFHHGIQLQTQPQLMIHQQNHQEEGSIVGPT